jgi:hypothetical protein
MALTGAVIGSARISLRRAMIAVAVMAAFLGAATAYLRRVWYYDAMGTFHRSQIVSILSGVTPRNGINCTLSRVARPGNNLEVRIFGFVWRPGMANY